MNNRDCDICQGLGVIRLPIRRQAVSLFNAGEPPQLQETSRQFPCPQCSNMVPEERLAIVSDHREYEANYDDPSLIFAIQANLARGLIDGLLRDGFVRLERSETDPTTMRFGVKVSIGVVHPEHVTSLESRIEAHQDRFATEVVMEARKHIANWGSDYTGLDGPIHKATAINAVEDALRNVRAKRQKPHALKVGDQ